MRFLCGRAQIEKLQFRPSQSKRRKWRLRVDNKGGSGLIEEIQHHGGTSAVIAGTGCAAFDVFASEGDPKITARATRGEEPSSASRAVVAGEEARAPHSRCCRATVKTALCWRNVSTAGGSSSHRAAFSVCSRNKAKCLFQWPPNIVLLAVFMVKRLQKYSEKGGR